MLPDRVSNPGPLTYESGALPIALRGPHVCMPYITTVSLKCNVPWSLYKLHVTGTFFVFGRLNALLSNMCLFGCSFVFHIFFVCLVNVVLCQ